MLRIKFSHHYPKLHGQTMARLVHVELKNRNDLHSELMEYDTFWQDPDGKSGTYVLPNGFVLVLYFVGDKGIPFCTIRRAWAKKQSFYLGHKGDIFNIEIVPEEAIVDHNQTVLEMPPHKAGMTEAPLPQEDDRDVPLWID